jgi:diguanylate cyclase (GGDEF)-like protein
MTDKERYASDSGFSDLPYRAGLATRMSRKMSAWVLFAALGGGTWAADENPALALIERGTVAMRSDPDASKQDAERALDIIRLRPDADLEIRARLLLCDYYSERDGGAAQQQIDAASALLSRAHRKGLRAGILTCQGETLETAGDNAHAMADFDEAVAVATGAKDEQQLAEALFSRGYLRALQGDYAAGMSDVRHSYELFDRIGMPQHALTVLNTIATIYKWMGDYEQASQIYDRVRSQQHDAGLRRDEAVTLHNLGRARLMLGKWEAARVDFSGCLTLSEALHYTRGEAYALLGLATVDNATADPNGALSTLVKAAQLQRRTPDARLNAQIQLARGTALRQLQRGAEALSALEQSEAVFKQANSLEELGTTYGELAIVHSQMGDWRGAYKYRSEAQLNSETLLHNQLDQRFATLKVEFDTATKERENALLLRQNAADHKALVQEQRVATLQTIVILLSLLLLGLLTTLVLYQRRGTRHMRALAMTDELTGVPNRRAALTHLDTLLQQADALPCSILMIDIDHFKSINDQYGHQVGDETLRLLTTKLRSAVAEPAFLGRLGGEEFVVALPTTLLHEARLVADQIRAQVPLIDLGHRLGERRITVSIGVTTSTRADTVSAMLRRADAALYAAKYAGRNCVRTDLAAGVDAVNIWSETLHASGNR